MAVDVCHDVAARFSEIKPSLLACDELASYSVQLLHMLLAAELPAFQRLFCVEQFGWDAHDVCLIPISLGSEVGHHHALPVRFSPPVGTYHLAERSP